MILPEQHYHYLLDHFSQGTRHSDQFSNGTRHRIYLSYANPIPTQTTLERKSHRHMHPAYVHPLKTSKRCQANTVHLTLCVWAGQRQHSVPVGLP